MKHLLLLLCLIGITSSIFGQGDFKINTNEVIPKEQDTTNVAKSIKKGDKAFKDGLDGFSKALDYYLLAYAVNQDYAPLNYKIAICYTYSSQYNKALNMLLECDELVDPYYHYYLGRAYHNSLMFAEAQAEYYKFLNSKYENTALIEHVNFPTLIKECENGISLVEDSTYALVEPLTQINTPYNEYQPVLTDSSQLLIYTSDNKEQKKKSNENSYSLDLKKALENDSTLSIISAGKNINNKASNAITSYNGFEETLIIYDGKSGNGDLLTAVNKKGKWQVKGEPVKNINTKYKESEGIFINENTFVFTSNRKGTKGGLDIYMTERNTKGRWTKPENLGNTINTQYDEFICSADTITQTLFFASRGEQSMGGYDIFKIKYTNRIGWTAPKNMNYPYSTPADDYSYLEVDSLTAIVCGIRPEGSGGADLFKVTEIIVEPDLHFSINGSVIDASTQKAIADASIMLYNIDKSDILAKAKSDSTGAFYVTVEEKQEVMISLEALDYKSKETAFQPNASEDSLFSKTFEMVEIIKYIPTYNFDLLGHIQDSISGLPIQAAVTIYDTDTTEIAQLFSSANGAFQSALDDRRLPYLCKIDAPNYPIAWREVKMPENDSSSYYSTTLIISPTKVEPLIIKGAVIDSKTKEAIYATIIYTNTVSGENTTIYTDSITGNYSFGIEELAPTIIDVKADDYLFAYEVVLFDEKPDTSFIERNFELISTKKGAKIVLDNILFVSGKSTVTESSYTTLDKLANILSNSDGIRIEISGHTDNTGSLAINNKLSKLRARAVVNYLIEKGVEESQLEVAGYGPSQPLEDNGTAEGRAKNRRVELKIID